MSDAPKHTCWNDMTGDSCFACAQTACDNDPAKAAQFLQEALSSIISLLGPNVREADIDLAKTLVPELTGFLEHGQRAPSNRVVAEDVARHTLAWGKRTKAHLDEAESLISEFTQAYDLLWDAADKDDSAAAMRALRAIACDARMFAARSKV